MILNVNDEIKNKLKKTNFSKGFIENCIHSKFFAVKEENSKWIGICFVGGLLNTNGIELLEEARGKGLGKKLLNQVLNECKKRNIHFLSGVFKDTNTISIKIHTNVGYRPAFNFYYNETQGNEIVVILPFTKIGFIFYKFLKIFNTKLGNACFGILLIILKPFFRNLITFEGNKMPKINLIQSIKKFKKV